jgi:hypothetical protein
MSKATKGAELVTLPVTDLTPNPRNPRDHDEKQLAHLQASLERFGQTRPLIARKANKMLIAGHGVLMAAKRAGWEQIKVLLWDCSQEDADTYMLADNRHSDLSDHDGERVAELLRDVVDPADLFAAGFDPADVDDLLRGLEDSTKIEVMDLDLDTVHDDFWISVRGPLAKQAEVLQRLKELLAEHPDVSVDLGVVGG